jgi:hypothetical protein
MRLLVGAAHDLPIAICLSLTHSATVPDAIKAEMLNRIRTFLQQQSM